MLAVTRPRRVPGAATSTQAATRAATREISRSCTSSHSSRKPSSPTRASVSPRRRVCRSRAATSTRIESPAACPCCATTSLQPVQPDPEHTDRAAGAGGPLERVDQPVDGQVGRRTGRSGRHAASSRAAGSRSVGAPAAWRCRTRATSSDPPERTEEADSCTGTGVAVPAPVLHQPVPDVPLTGDDRRERLEGGGARPAHQQVVVRGGAAARRGPGPAAAAAASLTVRHDAVRRQDDDADRRLLDAAAEQLLGHLERCSRADSPPRRDGSRSGARPGGRVPGRGGRDRTDLHEAVHLVGPAQAVPHRRGVPAAAAEECAPSTRASRPRGAPGRAAVAPARSSGSPAEVLLGPVRDPGERPVRAVQARRCPWRAGSRCRGAHGAPRGRRTAITASCSSASTTWASDRSGSAQRMPSLVQRRSPPRRRTRTRMTAVSP